jgi:hypothetical protein
MNLSIKQNVSFTQNFKLFSKLRYSHILSSLQNINSHFSGEREEDRNLLMLISKNLMFQKKGKYAI